MRGDRGDRTRDQLRAQRRRAGTAGGGPGGGRRIGCARGGSGRTCASTSRRESPARCRSARCPGWALSRGRPAPRAQGLQEGIGIVDPQRRNHHRDGLREPTGSSTSEATSTCNPSVFSLAEETAFPACVISTRYQSKMRQMRGWVRRSAWMRPGGSSWRRAVKPRRMRTPSGEIAAVKPNSRSNRAHTMAARLSMMPMKLMIDVTPTPTPTPTPRYPVSTHNPMQKGAQSHCPR